MDVMKDREVWGLNLELLPPQPSRKRRAMKKEDVKFNKMPFGGRYVRIQLLVDIRCKEDITCTVKNVKFVKENFVLKLEFGDLWKTKVFPILKG